MRKFFAPSDSGDSLVEVVVATVILGLFGLVVLASIASNRPLSDAVSLQASVLTNLNSAANQLELQPFAICSPTLPAPYSLATSIPQAANPTPSPAGSLAITTNQLPVLVVGTTVASIPFSAINGTGGYVWSVTPRLPAGLVLSSAGVLSGTPQQAISATYAFKVKSTVSGVSVSVTRNLVLTSATLSVQVKNGSTWVSCGSVPKITGVSVASAGNGSLITYTYTSGGSFTYNSGTALIVGDVVTISNISPAALNVTSGTITSVTPTTFTIAGTSIATSTTSGELGYSKTVNVQTVTLGTYVGKKLFTRVVAKAT